MVSTSGSSAMTGARPRLSRGIFQKLRGLGRWQPMTNLPGRPLASSESAITAAMTAPTNPTPMTTTISLPSARAASAKASTRANSCAYSPDRKRNASQMGLSRYWTMCWTCSLPLVASGPLSTKPAANYSPRCRELASAGPAPAFAGARFPPSAIFAVLLSRDSVFGTDFEHQR